MTAASSQARPAPPRPGRTVVVGGGIVGTACAVELLTRGHQVTLIAPSDPGGEDAASFGNAGWLSSHSIIPPAGPGVWKKIPSYLMDPLGPLAIRWRQLPAATPWLLRYLAAGWTWERVRGTALRLRPLLVDAVGLHRKLADRASAGHLIEHRGLLHAFPSRQDFDNEAAAWRIRREAGVQWDELDEPALRAAEPGLDPRYRFAVHVGEAGSCRDPGRYAAALFAFAREAGAEYLGGRVIDWERASGRLSGVRLADGRLVGCDAAVLSAGVQSGPLAALAGDRVPLAAERGYHAQLEVDGVSPNTSLSVSDCKAVINRMDNGLRIAGQVEIAAIDAPPDWRRARILRDHLFTIFRDLPSALPDERIRYWLGSRPSLPDGLPCIGRASALPEVVLAFGHGHVGLVGSARTARLVAQILSNEPTDCPLDAFSARRFA